MNFSIYILFIYLILNFLGYFFLLKSYFISKNMLRRVEEIQNHAQIESRLLDITMTTTSLS